jgi:hypothetical protein
MSFVPTVPSLEKHMLVHSTGIAAALTALSVVSVANLAALKSVKSTDDEVVASKKKRIVWVLSGTVAAISVGVFVHAALNSRSNFKKYLTD